jgi:hypothetical protein
MSPKSSAILAEFERLQKEYAGLSADEEVAMPAWLRHLLAK